MSDKYVSNNPNHRSLENQEAIRRAFGTKHCVREITEQVIEESFGFTDSYREYQRENRGNHINSDEI